MELTDIALEVIEAEKEQKLASIVRGRKNYVIRTEMDNGVTAYVGTLKALHDKGLKAAFLVDVVKYHIRWFYFTYKKDFMTAVNILEENGCEVIWI